ncbi:MAG: class I SAM-dependent methyltransferase [Candidatus Bathyarchaeia archaeon]|jgi:ubiquinone/menaquinone biosynthesis C-methylase UbiE
MRHQADKSTSEWQNVEHALAYLARADKLPHRTEAEKVLLDQIPPHSKRVLDLGTGNGRLMALIRLSMPNVEGVALDFSEPMLKQAKLTFANDLKVTVFKHDLSEPLPKELGCFDVVVSSLAIHHLVHHRKMALYGEVFGILNSGGFFCNFEHVAPASMNLHLQFLSASGLSLENEDPSNKLLDVETQLGWLREIGFVDVDCYWKWLEIAVLAGFKP